MHVTARTLRRWSAMLERETGYDHAQCSAIAAGWEQLPFDGGRRLLREVQNFANEGFSADETLMWLSAGQNLPTAVLGRSHGASPQQVASLLDCIFDEDHYPTLRDRAWADLDSGVPVGLICLIYWAGCTSNSEFDNYLRRWRDGEDVEPELRLLAALRVPDNPIPHVKAPADYPPPPSGASAG